MKTLLLFFIYALLTIIVDSQYEPGRQISLSNSILVKSKPSNATTSTTTMSTLVDDSYEDVSSLLNNIRTIDRDGYLTTSTRWEECDDFFNIVTHIRRMSNNITKVKFCEPLLADSTTRQPTSKVDYDDEGYISYQLRTLSEILKTPSIAKYFRLSHKICSIVDLLCIIVYLVLVIVMNRKVNCCKK